MSRPSRKQKNKLPKANGVNELYINISVPFLVTAILILAGILGLVLVFMGQKYQFSFFVNETGEQLEGEIFLNDRFLGYAKDGNFSMDGSKLYPGVVSLKGGYNGSKFHFQWKLTEEDLDDFSGLNFYVTEDDLRIYQTSFERNFDSNLSRSYASFIDLYKADSSLKLEHEMATLYVNFNSSGPVTLYFVKDESEFYRFLEKTAPSYLTMEARIKNYSSCVDALPGYGIIVYNAAGRDIRYNLELSYVQSGKPCPAK